MARKIVHQLIDDIDGTEIAQGEGETVTFAFDGSTYEIDLTLDNAKALREMLRPYISAGRKTTGRGKSSYGAKARTSAQHDLSAIRAWASENGHSVADRGRVPQVVVDAYYAAN